MPLKPTIGGYNVIATINGVGRPRRYLHLCIEEILEATLKEHSDKNAPSKIVIKPRLVFKPDGEGGGKEDIITENGMRITFDKTTGEVKKMKWGA